MLNFCQSKKRSIIHYFSYFCVFFKLIFDRGLAILLCIMWMSCLYRETSGVLLACLYLCLYSVLVYLLFLVKHTCNAFEYIVFVCQWFPNRDRKWESKMGTRHSSFFFLFFYYFLLFFFSHIFLSLFWNRPICATFALERGRKN